MSNIKLITFKCDWCDKESLQKIGNYNRHTHHFCSGSCAQNYRWKESNIIKEKKLKEIIECGCGCGQKLNRWTLIQESGGLRERRYINGHSGNLPNIGQFKNGSSPWNKNLTKEEDERLDYERPNKFKKGIKFNKEYRIKMSCGMRGISISEFDDFASNKLGERKHLDEQRAHKEWRSKIFQRDNYACQNCGAKSGEGKAIYLQAHHIKPWKEFPELRREMNNGVTLCKDCHLLVHRKDYKGEFYG
jgi:hypothetical protein